jgi:spoIIIJ-associated protein
MDSIEADGSSIDQAIDNALKSLGATRDRVEIEILSNATRGLFGIGGRRARVRATLRSPIDLALRSALPPAPVPTPVRPTPQNGGPDAGTSLPSDHVIARATGVLEELLKHINVPASVLAKTEDGLVVLELSGDSSGVLIGRRGQMLDALEYLINRVVGHDESRPPRIVVDSEDYRARRRQALEDLARRMGAQAKRKRRAVTLNPMSPRDRRIIHMMLQTDPSLTTKSSGKGYFRKLIIIPAGAGRAARKDE